MPETHPIEKLGRKLLRHGLPHRYVARIVEELTEHQDDLAADELALGRPAEATRSAACERLGDIDELAMELLQTKRRSYWWGRHPVVSFVLLPLPMFLLAFFGILWVWAEGSGLIAWSEHRESFPEPDWPSVRVWFYAVLGTAFTISISYICYLTRRCCCGLRWALTGCGIFFGLTLFLHFGFTPPQGPSPANGRFWISFGATVPSPPQLIAWAVPLSLFVLYCAIVRRGQLTETTD